MSTRPRTTATTGDRGVTIVEAAFALPILLMFIFGLVDIGMWTFNSNQATNAARDGARAAILSFEGLDDPNSADRARVLDAVQARLDRTVDSVSVSCRQPDGSATACATARVDVDSVRVEVEWDWQLVTPIAAVLGYDEGRAAGSATMSLVGIPYEAAPGATTTTLPDGTTTTTATIPNETTTTTTAATCTDVDGSFSVSPLTVRTTRYRSNQLVEELTFAFTTNGSPLCDDLKVVLISPQDNGTNNKRETFKCGCGSGPTSYSGTYTGSTNIWGDTGTWRAVLTNRSDTLDTVQFTVQSGS